MDKSATEDSGLQHGARRNHCDCLIQPATEVNVSTVEREVHTDNLLVVGVDVSKDKLDLHADHTDPVEKLRQELDGEIPNRGDEIEEMLRRLAGCAEEKGLEGLLVICEPTGGYEDQLFETARRLGHETAYANGEHVSKASVIESGDPGKTDSMDARVIAMIGEMDKTHSALPTAIVYNRRSTAVMRRLIGRKLMSVRAGKMLW